MKKLILPIWTLLLFLQLFGCKEDDNSVPIIASVNVSSNDMNASETGDNGNFTFKLTERIEADLQVNYSLSGTATNGEDYTTLSGMAIIAANTLSTKITIMAFDDETDEDTESVTITIVDTNNKSVAVGSSKQASLQIEDAPTLAEILLAETRLEIVNANATDQTVALFYNLKNMASSNFIVGQQDAFSSFFGNNGGDADIKKSTGSDPGLLGSDFMFITDDKNTGSPSNWFFQQERMIKQHAIDAYNKGMINTFVWHFREPFEGEYFNTSQLTEFQNENAFISLLPGGENHEYYKLKLKKVAEVAQSLVGQDGNLVPIIFRPFHEFDGNWFWWGAAYSSPDEFITLWKFTVDYLVEELNVNNMLFAYSPDNTFFNEADYLARYPGDGYVDILGMDNYGDFDENQPTGLEDANLKLSIISNIAIEKNKVAALTESCYFVTPEINTPLPNFYGESLFKTLTDNEINISYMMFWSNSENSYCTPPPGQQALEDFMNFIGKPESLLIDELPDMYTIDPPTS